MEKKTVEGDEVGEGSAGRGGKKMGPEALGESRGDREPRRGLEIG